MDIQESFRRLGIEPTKDKTQIKKAYAEKAKICHPEEHPEEWQILHTAYQNALAYAKKQPVRGNAAGISHGESSYRGQNKESTDSGTEYAKMVKQEFMPPAKPDHKSAEGPVQEDNYEDIFENLTSYVFQEKHDWKLETQHILSEIENAKLFVRKTEWMKLFTSEAYEKCRGDEEIVCEVLRLIEKKQYFYASVEMIYENLMDLKIYLSNMEQYRLVQSVGRTLEELEDSWKYHEKDRIEDENSIKGRVRPLIQNYWHVPFRVRYAVYFIITALVSVYMGDTILRGISWLFMILEVAHLSNGHSERKLKDGFIFMAAYLLLMSLPSLIRYGI